MAKRGAWSYTSLQSFITCPRQYEAKYVLKTLPFTSTPATEWGNQVHAALEKAVKDGAALPANMKQYQAVVDFVLSRPGKKYTELPMGLTAEGEPCGFFDKNCDVRGKIDLLIIDGDQAWVVDYKTGKPKGDPLQLRLFALFVFHHYPHIKRVRSMYLWLGEEAKSPITKIDYTTEQLDDMWSDFDRELAVVDEAYAVGVFQPKPSGLCKEHCGVTTCEYYQKGRRYA